MSELAERRGRTLVTAALVGIDKREDDATMRDALRAAALDPERQRITPACVDLDDRSLIVAAIDLHVQEWLPVALIDVSSLEFTEAERDAFAGALAASAVVPDDVTGLDDTATP